MAEFVIHIRPIFYEIFEIFVVINQKICGIWCVELKFGMSDKHPQENEGMFTAKDVMPGKNFTAL